MRTLPIMRVNRVHFDRFFPLSAVPGSRLLALFLFLLPGVFAGAAVVPDLYAVEVPLVAAPPGADPAQAEENLTRAYSLAMARVLVRVTGQRDIAMRSEAAPLMEAAEQFIQQFTTRGDDALWVAFDGPGLERAVAASGLPIWNRDRPSILVWLAVDRGGGARELIGADSEDPIKQQVDDAAAALGLPLIWPLADSADRAAATVADIWGGFGERVASASERYRADVVLVGRLRGRTGQDPYGNWDLQSNAGAENWRGSVDGGLNQTADFLVSRLAAAAEVASITSITVSNVYSVEAYSNTLNYLERLSLIDNVQLRAARDDVFVFDVNVRGDSGQLRRAINVGRVLVSDDDTGLGLDFRYAR